VDAGREVSVADEVGRFVLVGLLSAEWLTRKLLKLA
jgi:hypothetical protein